MKKTFTFIIALIIVQTAANAQDTLRNLSSSATRTVNNYLSPSGWGYYTGHNHLSREEFAEKYYINGTRSLMGIISEHTGIVTNTANISQFKAYSVGTNRLPGTLIASKNVPYGQISLSGTPMLTLFNSPANVTDSFFVSFNLTDYAHGGFEGDTIGLKYGVDGSRLNSDLNIYGRNAIRRHSHAGPDWRDFYTQNFTSIKTHFALFPVLATTVGFNEIETSEFSIHSVYPNPCVNEINIKTSSLQIDQLEICVFSHEGKLVKKEMTTGNAEQLHTINMAEFAAGAYYILIKGKQTGLAVQIIKN